MEMFFSRAVTRSLYPAEQGPARLRGALTDKSTVFRNLASLPCLLHAPPETGGEGTLHSGSQIRQKEDVIGVYHGLIIADAESNRSVRIQPALWLERFLVSRPVGSGGEAGVTRLISICPH